MRFMEMSPAGALASLVHYVLRTFTVCVYMSVWDSCESLKTVGRLVIDTPHQCICLHPAAEQYVTSVNLS